MWRASLHTTCCIRRNRALGLTDARAFSPAACSTTLLNTSLTTSLAILLAASFGASLTGCIDTDPIGTGRLILSARNNDNNNNGNNDNNGNDDDDNDDNEAPLVSCLSNADCPDHHPVCSLLTELCVECLVRSDCAPGYRCYGARCVDDGRAPLPIDTDDVDDDDNDNDDNDDDDNNDDDTDDGNTCVGDCTGRVCGNDGCGGSCGICQPDYLCSSDGTCLDNLNLPLCHSAQTVYELGTFTAPCEVAIDYAIPIGFSGASPAKLEAVVAGEGFSLATIYTPGNPSPGSADNVIVAPERYAVAIVSVRAAKEGPMTGTLTITGDEGCGRLDITMLGTALPTNNAATDPRRTNALTIEREPPLDVLFVMPTTPEGLIAQSQLATALTATPLRANWRAAVISTYARQGQVKSPCGGTLALGVAHTCGPGPGYISHTDDGALDLLRSAVGVGLFGGAKDERPLDAIEAFLRTSGGTFRRKGARLVIAIVSPHDDHSQRVHEVYGAFLGTQRMRDNPDTITLLLAGGVKPQTTTPDASVCADGRYTKIAPALRLARLEGGLQLNTPSGSRPSQPVFKFRGYNLCDPGWAKQLLTEINFEARRPFSLYRIDTPARRDDALEFVGPAAEDPASWVIPYTPAPFVQNTGTLIPGLVNVRYFPACVE